MHIYEQHYVINYNIFSNAYLFINYENSRTN
jgi:hypothetical protein